MIRFFRKLFKRGDFMTRADKAYYKYRAKTIFWSAFCLIIISWVGTNLVLCALTTNVESNWDISYAPARDVDLPYGSTLNTNIKNSSSYSTVNTIIKTITFDYVGGDSSAAVVGVEPEIINEDDKIYLYRVNNGADIYILSPNNMHLRNGADTFAYLQALKTINFKNFKYDPVSSNSMREMFRHCSKLKSLDLSGWDTGLTYSFRSMFSDCSELETLEGIEDWDTSNVDSLYYMFSGCSALSTALDLSGWRTNKVTELSHMFQMCSSLPSLNLTGWETSKVWDLSGMFKGCEKLSILEGTGNWNTSIVIDMYCMFDHCLKLVTLDLSGWDTSNVTDMAMMFNQCTMLKTIYASDLFVTDNVEDSNSIDMFLNCYELTGGNGTTGADVYYSSDKEYARIDRDGQQGYFTEKA